MTRTGTTAPGIAPASRACTHTPTCPGADARDAAAARIVSEHLQDSGYALLCNGRLLLEGDGLLPRLPDRRTPGPITADVRPPAPRAA